MRTKITVPAAGMSSADWDGVDPDIRERSFWTAREGCYARVQGFRDRCQGIVDGNLSEADALREVRAMLRATGYQPGHQRRHGPATGLPGLHAGVAGLSRPAPGAYPLQPPAQGLGRPLTKSKLTGFRGRAVILYAPVNF